MPEKTAIAARNTKRHKNMIDNILQKREFERALKNLVVYRENPV